MSAEQKEQLVSALLQAFGEWKEKSPEGLPFTVIDLRDIAEQVLNT